MPAAPPEPLAPPPGVQLPSLDLALDAAPPVLAARPPMPAPAQAPTAPATKAISAVPTLSAPILPAAAGLTPDSSAPADIPIPMPGAVPADASGVADQIPTLEVGGMSRIHFIGGEKGGVGKSMVSRLMAQYFIDHGVPFAAFDTDKSHSTLRRFYGDYAQPVHVQAYESLDRIVETAIEMPGRRVLVDLAAQTHEALLRWMDESGVLDLADVSGIVVQYWHVMDAGRDSVDLLQRLLDRFGQRLQYVIVRNHLRGDDFSLLDRSGQLVRARGLGAKVIDVKHLHDTTVQKIDARSASFWNAKNSTAIDGASLSLMERQRLRLWMNHAYTGITAAGV
jgi:hypothetical protein